MRAARGCAEGQPQHPQKPYAGSIDSEDVWHPWKSHSIENSEEPNKNSTDLSGFKALLQKSKLRLQVFSRLTCEELRFCMDVEYKIIGGDGREYGPVTLEELKSWIRDGRVAAATQVWRNDLAAWSPAAAYVELAGEWHSLPRHSAPVVVESKLGGFWARLAAYIIDAIILSLVFEVVFYALSALFHWQIPEFPAITSSMDQEAMMQALTDYFQKLSPIMMPYFLIGKAIQAAYEIPMNARFGATVGKMLIGLKIVRLDGSPIGFQTASLRWLGTRISDLICYIGYLFIAFRTDKRALHDLLAGTKVIFKR